MEWRAGSEWQALGMRASEQTQQFHDAAMSSSAEALRVQYDAIPHRARRSKLMLAAVALAAATTLATAVVLLS